MRQMMRDEHIRQRLHEEKAQILDLRDATDDDRAVVELDQNTQGRLSRMDALQRQAMAQATDQRRAQRLAQIDAALKRLDEGEFGACVDCGGDIEPERLDAEICVLKCKECSQI